ncbi:MAG: sulfonate ABC transporter permease [Bacillus thermozeamaize]|jgi:NitT/TauT family transport system permease protein|uniref:Sulfonate ABC transporter permease n=1 Tax=Bacillus thermozeamaize TaxID=230954 RepID=A0A1Y3Q0F8_9BACI|nr:MAG: sulfonate ABC transporter permease [Bacillus thermozeamaize]
MSALKKTSNVMIGVFALILVWQGIVLIGKYEESLFPPPAKVLQGIVSLIQNGTLFVHLKVSLFRFVIGYLSAVILAVVLGLILGRMQRLWAIVDPIVQVLRPISPIAWSPFIVLWFGIGDAPAIVIIFLAAFFPVLLSTISGVRRVDQTYLKVAQNLEIRKHHLLTKIIFPAAFPSIANGLHLAIGTSWIFLVSGEMVGAQSGLGYLIVDARNLLRLDLVFAGIIFIGICGLLLDKLIRLFERWIEKKWGIVTKQ